MLHSGLNSSIPLDFIIFYNREPGVIIRILNELPGKVLELINCNYSCHYSALYIYLIISVDLYSHEVPSAYDHFPIFPILITYHFIISDDP